MPLMMESPNVLEIFLSILCIILIIESGRRTVGIIFPSIATLMVLYALYGHYIPGKFGHGQIFWQPVLKQIYFTNEGIWGFLTGASATYIALFVIFGAFLLKTGAGQTFMDLAILITGRFRGGAAKVSVVASGFFSMMSGSPMANVITTGNFTIPMMKN